MGIVARGVGKSLGNPPARILSDVSFRVDDGEFVALTGRSGSGKSSLLYLLSSLDIASEGTIEVDGRNLAELRGDALCRFRNEEVGFVFQFHYLLAELNAVENILMPARKRGEEASRKARAEALLDEFGLKDKGGRLPHQLSGGEQQRIAIARALIMDPKYLFADEPTGSLDTDNSETVMEILRESNRRGTTIVMVTHEPDFARRAERQIQLADGRLVGIARQDVAASAAPSRAGLL